MNDQSKPRVIQGKLLRIQRLDATGQPVGEPIELNQAVEFQIGGANTGDLSRAAKLKFPIEVSLSDEHDHSKCCTYLRCAHPKCCGYYGEPGSGDSKAKPAE